MGTNTKLRPVYNSGVNTAAMLIEACLFWQVKQMVRSEEFKSMTSRVGPEAKQRRVWEVLDSAAGLPPPPLRSAYSSRSPSSRQVLPISALILYPVPFSCCPQSAAPALVNQVIDMLQLPLPLLPTGTANCQSLPFTLYLIPLLVLP